MGAPPPEDKKDNRSKGYGLYDNQIEDSSQEGGEFEESVEERMKRADKLIKDANLEEKRGFSLDDNRKSPGAGIQTKKEKEPSDESDINDNYEDDFDEDIEEDI